MKRLCGWWPTPFAVSLRLLLPCFRQGKIGSSKWKCLLTIQRFGQPERHPYWPGRPILPGESRNRFSSVLLCRRHAEKFWHLLPAAFG
jgi:hypothetical protein